MYIEGIRPILTPATCIYFFWTCTSLFLPCISVYAAVYSLLLAFQSTFLISSPCSQAIDRHSLRHTSVHWDSDSNKARGNAIRPQWPIWNGKEREAVELEERTRDHMKQQKERLMHICNKGNLGLELNQ
ncbi:hypothetical protein AABB24_009279 [Solanum stoloniferum]|uniref:Uncharacterized protein n=1 Tax=Solanum stoloniferum TaxID=62892 RepID=A0ABD2UI75_9SOLN